VLAVVSALGCVVLVGCGTLSSLSHTHATVVTDAPTDAPTDPPATQATAPPVTAATSPPAAGLMNDVAPTIRSSCTDLGPGGSWTDSITCQPEIGFTVTYYQFPSRAAMDAQYANVWNAPGPFTVTLTPGDCSTSGHYSQWHAGSNPAVAGDMTCADETGESFAWDDYNTLVGAAVSAPYDTPAVIDQWFQANGGSIAG
jgi:hypothetical protein